MKTERADGLVLPAAWFVGRNIRRVAEMALTHRLPTIFWRRDFPEVGGLLAYGPDDTHYWRRLGEMVVKVLKGTKPTDLPIEQVDRFRLAINLKTAKSLGLAIPQTLLLRADQVIQ
jgi:putative ABC transport system substrate-binding protein